MKSVGVIGLGIMGSAMSANLVKAGFKVHGYDIAPAQRGLLKQAGGTPAISAQEVSSLCEVVITSLPSAQALHDVCGELKGKCIVVETSTLPIEDKLCGARSPAEKRHHSARLSTVRHRRPSEDEGPRGLWERRPGRF